MSGLNASVCVEPSAALIASAHLERLQCLLEDLPAPREMAAHDWMFCVRLCPIGLAVIFHIGAEEIGRQLIFHILDRASIGVAKEKADHPIIEHSVNKCINDRSQLGFASELLEKSLVMGSSDLSRCLQDVSENDYIMPS